VAGRIRLIGKSSDLIGNQTCDPLDCSIVPQGSTLLPARMVTVLFLNIVNKKNNK
jgi:hypothetical protein